MTDPVWVRFSSVLAAMARAMPKSATLTWPAGGDQHVAGLDVAVDHAVAVGEAERAGDVGGDRRRPASGCSGPSLRRISDSAAPVDVLHHDVVGARLLAPVVDADDVGVVEVGGGLGLPAEALDERRVGGELGEQDLDRDRAVEQLVTREEHLGHAAAGDRAVELVAPVEDDLFTFDMARQPTFVLAGPAGTVVLATAAAATCRTSPSPPWRWAPRPGHRWLSLHRSGPRR